MTGRLLKCLRQHVNRRFVWAGSWENSNGRMMDDVLLLTLRFRLPRVPGGFHRWDPSHRDAEVGLYRADLNGELPIKRLIW